jgi:hypothetical protein
MAYCRRDLHLELRGLILLAGSCSLSRQQQFGTAVNTLATISVIRCSVPTIDSTA